MADPTLSNEDLAPTRPEQRTWSMWHIAALWVGMAVCIPTYKLGADLIQNGWSLKMAMLSVIVGNVVILVPLVLNAHPGTRYGIPFPVLLRSSFGVLGANVPAMMRALVACGWFGIQTWIGGSAIFVLWTAMVPASWELPQFLPAWFGISTGQLIAFIAFWLINVYFIVKGMESIKWMETLAAPFLLVLGLALLFWAWHRVGGLGPMLADPVPPTKGGLSALAIGMTGAVAFWGTLALNIPDFARFARSQKDQIAGQAIGLPATMALFTFIGAVVTNATVLIYGHRIADPDVLAAQIGGPALSMVALLGLAVATLSTNVAANIVSPANDLSNLAPGKINFRRGGLIAATIGAVILPWKLMASAKYLFVWLLGYGAMLGAVGGIMIADYYLLRRRVLNVDDLYRRGGEYEYRGGFNPVALLALAIGIAPNVPGFLAAAGGPSTSPFFARVYEWAWFVSFFLAGAIYLAGMKLQKK
ncbi:MAG TPA: NCS1 family nucleobase:cation symporter-1 [Kofleriaceae bacterium]|nr:NCS1 family nucleobase:cation symporter-1 [Kofleriaceae bacterium]